MVTNYKVRDIADRELDAHERTFDPDNMRDFVDVYVREMKGGRAPIAPLDSTSAAQSTDAQIH